MSALYSYQNGKFVYEGEKVEPIRQTSYGTMRFAERNCSIKLNVDYENCPEKLIKQFEKGIKKLAIDVWG